MKLLILDKDRVFSSRLKHSLEKKYHDIQMFICDNPDCLDNIFEGERFDVIIFESEFDTLDKEKYDKQLKGAAFAYISSTHEIIGDTETLYKYVSVSKWYSSICNLYEKKKDRVVKKENMREITGTQIITFLPANGGAGSSTMSVACALSLAQTKSVLYINMEQRSSDEVFFKGSSKKCLSDIIAVLKTKYTDKVFLNTMKEVIQDGVALGDKTIPYIKGYNNIMDSLSVNGKYVNVLLDCIKTKFNYDYVIIDTDYIVGDFLNKLIVFSDDLVFVYSGSDTSDVKFNKIKRHLEILSRGEDVKMPEVRVLLNQYYSQNSTDDVIEGFDVICRLARYRTDNGTRISSQNVISEVLQKPGLFACFLPDESKPEANSGDDKK